MSFFKPEFNTYQDVKTTLAWWSVPLWTLATWVTWRVVLEEIHREWLLAQIPDLASWLTKVGPIGASIAIGLLLAHVLVHVVEIHDHFYDRYLVKWRKRYVSDYIIPELLTPVLDRLPINALEVAIENWRRCMKLLFYHFATDRDTRIDKNLLVRFYERVTKYWFAQLAEISIIALAIVSLFYAIVLVVITDITFSTRFIWLWLALLAAFTLTKVLSIRLRIPIKEATADEIEAIHSHEEFRSQLELFCGEVGISFNA